MKLTEILSGQLNAAEWEQKGYELPKFDIAKVREKTAKQFLTLASRPRGSLKVF